MKLLGTFREQIQKLGPLKRVWLTSFNINIEFIETYLISAVLGMDPPRSRVDYEAFQIALSEKQIDFRVFCDVRCMEANKNKRTAIPVHGISPRKSEEFSKESLFHPKVIYLEDTDGKMIIGAGSANLTFSGWGRNQEAFRFFGIESKDQYLSAREFFKEVFKNVGEESPLGNRRFSGKGVSWSFVHSFQKNSLLDQLFEKQKIDQMLVWSPYFPRDLTGFVDRLKNKYGREDLNLAIVPDRVEGKYIRTRWTAELAKRVKNGSISFYENPVQRHQNSDLCHAKIWKVPGKLAIGSWNFTGPGSNSKVDDNNDRSESNNIEAGFIIKISDSWGSAVGKKLTLNASDFASEELLEKESLDLPDELPFDIQVSFDWKKQCYSFNGNWQQGDIDNNYCVELPDVSPIALIWKPRSKELDVASVMVDDPFKLLEEHRFYVRLNKELKFTGLITESDISYRRSQGFGTLRDLLDSLILGADPTGGDQAPIRYITDETSELSEDFNSEDELIPASGESTTNISYFRLFQATEEYATRIKSVNSADELNIWVFKSPSCLQDLCAKSKQKIENAEPSVFNWFLANEVNLLVELALKRRSQLGARENPIPKSRWDALAVPVPILPFAIDKDYVDLMMQECGYETV